VPVVGRTRWLRVPYRNTRQIYQAAYEVIRKDDLLQRSLQEQFGAALEPDLSGEYLRSGPRPTLRQFHSLDEEGTFIRSEVEWLLQKGFDASEMVVLHRRTSGVRKLAGYLRGLDVEATTLFTCVLFFPIRLIPRVRVLPICLTEPIDCAILDALNSDKKPGLRTDQG
jgi:hypothetical protein